MTNNKKTSGFSKEEKNLIQFKNNLEKFKQSFKELSESTVTFLEMIYRDRDRRLVSLKKRESRIDVFLGDWEEFVERLDRLRDEICEVCDYGEEE